MNINLSSVSESPKAAKVVSESIETDGEVTESGGFFSKLASLIKGEGSDEAKSAKAATDAETTGESDTEVEDIKVASAKSQSADELLSDESSSDEGSSDSEAQAVKGAGEALAQEENDDPELTSKGASGQDATAEKIVSENDQVLQRLDEANKALQPKDGKPLPQTEANPLANDNSELTEGDEQQVKSQLNGGLTAVKAGDAALDSATADSEVVIPESAQRFVQSSQEQALMTEADETKVQSAEAVVAASVLSDEIDLENLTEQQVSEIKAAQAITEEEVAAVTDKPDSDNSVKEQASDNDLELVTTASGAAVLASGAAAVTGESATQVTKGAAQKVETVTPTVDATSQVDAAQSAEQVDPTIAAATVATASAIPWASSEVASEELIAQEAKAKPQVGQAQPAVVAQSVQQALTAQGSQTPLPNTQTSLPPDLALNMVNSAAAAPNVTVAQDQALLKAALGANAAAGIGKLAKGSDTSGAQGESSFAQQIAQASGQQAGTQFNAVRAEQVAAHAPLQLNREMAGDQVAERVQMMMSKNLKNIDIRLDPPELGRMQIRMNMNGDGTAVHFTVANQQARDVIEQSMPRLREMLAQQGLQLSDTSVQQQSSGQQGRYAADGQGQSGQGSGNQTLTGEENLEPDINLDLNVAAKRDGISYYA